MNDQKRLWNTTELEAFGLHRATIRKRLKEAGIVAIASKGSTPLYDIFQVAPYLCKTPRKEQDAPDLMGFKTAAELRAFIQAEREKLSFSVDAGELVPRIECDEQIAILTASIKKFADKLITLVEGDIPNATGEQLESLENSLSYELLKVSETLSK